MWMCVGEPDFFLLFRKIKSLVLSGNDVKWNYSWSWCNVLWKLHVWENLFLKLWQKMLLSSEILIFFKYQYFINILTSDFEFLNIDRHEKNEWKEQGLSTHFWRKKMFRVKMPFLAQKKVDPNNFESLSRIYRRSAWKLHW